MRPRVDRSGYAGRRRSVVSGCDGSTSVATGGLVRRRRGLALALALAVGTGCPATEESPAPAPAPIVPRGDLVAAAHPTPVRILVASADGEIHRSEDGGESWLRARVPANGGLTALAMADPERGWAVGPGVALRTRDGGAVWERQRLPGRAAEQGLVAVDGPDPGEAIALRDDGALLRWLDDGRGWRLERFDQALWEATDAKGERSVPRSVSCARSPEHVCVIAGGSVLALSLPPRDSGEGSDGGHGAWRSIPVRPPVELAPFVFRPGRVDLSAADRARLTEAATSVAGRAVDWRIEAFVSAVEIERYADRRDPSALFERIEARAQELRAALEAAGVDAERIRIVGEPPWEYEERIDDDPGLVARYIRARRADRPSAIVRAVERFDLRAVALASDGRLAAAGTGPHVLWRWAGEAVLRRAPNPTPYPVLAMAWLREGLVLAGHQGVIRRLERPSDGAEPSPMPGLVEIEGPAFFEPIRALAAAPGGERVVAVGAAGRVLVSRDGGAHWRSVSASTQADRPRFR